MPSPNSLAALRRVPTPLVLVGGLHLVVLWALLNGLQIHNAPAMSPTDIIADVIDRVAPPREPPPPESYLLPKLQFTIPEPKRLVVEDETQTVTAAVPDNRTAPQPELQNLAGSAADPQRVIIAAAVDRSHPLTQPPYPMASRRLGEAGAIALNILVGADGRVRDANVSQSSGFERLDQAAMSEAKQHWRLRPATHNGVPFEQWITLKVVFRFADR